MSTSSVTPDQSSLANAVPSSAPSNYVEQNPAPAGNYVSQSSQNPPAEVADPGPANGPSRLNTVLSRIVGQPTVVNASKPSPGSGGFATTPEDADETSGARPGWKSALGKVAQVVSTGMSGIPDKGRPSFISGLGEGARSEKQAEATAQAIKFQDFDTQVRLANLHHQDQELQLRTQIWMTITE